MGNSFWTGMPTILLFSSTLCCWGYCNEPFLSHWLYWASSRITVEWCEPGVILPNTDRRYIIKSKIFTIFRSLYQVHTSPPWAYLKCDYQKCAVIKKNRTLIFRKKGSPPSHRDSTLHHDAVYDVWFAKCHYICRSVVRCQKFVTVKKNISFKRFALLFSVCVIFCFKVSNLVCKI